MGDEFIRGYIHLAEGEKDPRNLLLAFAIDRVLLIEFNVVNWIEVGRPQNPDHNANELSCAGFLQHHLLLFPNHVQTSA